MPLKPDDLEKEVRIQGSRRIGRFCILLAVAWNLALPGTEQLLGGEPGSSVVWPERWKVFLPVDPDAPILEEEQRAQVPKAIRVGEETVEGRWVEPEPVENLHGISVSLDSALLDLSTLFGEVESGNTAYVYLPVESDRAQTVTLGFGADWWMTVWLNGQMILDTTESGNQTWPAMIDNHLVDAELREGANVLAIRFVSGAGSSLLAVGGPAQMAEMDRLLVTEPPAPDQAYWSAHRQLDWTLPDIDFSEGRVVGVQPMPSRQLFYGGEMSPQSVTGERRVFAYDQEDPRFEEPVRLLLSKSLYPAEDLHLDAVLWLTPEEEDADPVGEVDLILLDTEGREVARDTIVDLHRAGLFFSMGWPNELMGTKATLRAIWRDTGGEKIGQAEAGFYIDSPTDVARSGSVEIVVPNENKVVASGIPFTTGVPFPRGALHDESQVRLLDEEEREVPLQTRITSRWSRFGPVRWLLFDFTADLDGGARRFTLQYGPEIHRENRADIPVRLDGGQPEIEAGRLLVNSEGVFYDLEGAGDFHRFLDADALSGAYVEHADGRRFIMPPDSSYEIEEQGSEKVVLRRTGWYTDDEGSEFCNFITRVTFHRDSPVVRIHHTWIFTGDGNQDQIREMGWRVSLAEGMEDQRFLTSYDEVEDAWQPADFLLQWDYDQFDLVAGEEIVEYPGGRAPGVASAAGEEARVVFGARDFWQNFPSELEFADQALWFHNWPRHNRPASFDRPVPVDHAYRLRFAHEGETLNFHLPEEYAEEEIWAAMSGRRPASSHYALNQPETANAQGIARTEEMALYLAGGGVASEELAQLMKSFDDATLRPVVDPEWMAASGAFGRIRHKDAETYPEPERVYDLLSTAPARWAERLGVYGMWIYGDYAAWNFDLSEQASSPYRAFRKNHHGWPIRWLGYVRSGDPRLFRMAEAATRQMADANFCHFASEEVNEAVGPDYERRQGWWNRSILPWAGLPHNQPGPGTRFYAVESDYLWHSYYLTGARRGKDVALLFGDLIQDSNVRVVNVNRVSLSILSSALEMYQATFDPWFLTAIHAFKEMYLTLPDREGGWRPATRDLINFTGDDELRDLYLERIDPERRFTGHEQSLGWATWTQAQIEPHAMGYWLTGNDYYVQRIAHELDRARMDLFEGEPDYYLGRLTWRQPSGFTSWYLHYFPYAMAVIDAAGGLPSPVPTAFAQAPGHVQSVTVDGQRTFEVRPPEIFFQKPDDQEAGLFFRAMIIGEVLGHYDYFIENSEGAEVLSGRWTLPETSEVKLPAELPGGTYRLRLEGLLPRGNVRGFLYLPLVHRDLPEVFVFESSEEGTAVPAAFGHAQYWFRVPGNVEEFWVEFPIPEGEIGRFSIWSPDEERAWDLSFHEAHYDGPRPARAVVPVSSEHAGQLWRITYPQTLGDDRGFLLDPQIPPIFSGSKEKWFDPSN